MRTLLCVVGDHEPLKDLLDVVETRPRHRNVAPTNIHQLRKPRWAPSRYARSLALDTYDVRHLVAVLVRPRKLSSVHFP